MSAITEPLKFPVPFAETGLKNAIPATANNATGKAGFDKGFPERTMLPKASGGIPPSGMDFNGILYDITSAIRYMQAGGKPTYDAGFAAAIGGYPLGAVLIGDDGVSVFQNDVAGNETNPNAGGDGWARPDLQVMELYRRSYAEAGYNVVGTFQAGFTLVNANDVGIDLATGKGYTGPAGMVAAGTNPASGGFVDKSGALLSSQIGFNAAHYGLSESNSGYQNCKALQALSAAVIAAGGGKVYFPSGDYTVGAQNFAGATGKGYAYQYEKMFEAAGLTKPLSVHFDGVRFKFADGLRYGSFDPVTGAPISPTLPYYNNDSRAQTGYVINISNCPIVSAEGSLEIDGRDSARIIGGLWGDKGRQLIEYGLRIANCSIYTVDGAFYFHNLCLDGLYLGNRADDDCAGTITGVVSLYNGRQGVSVCGGRSITFNSCALGLTGFGAVNTAPAAAVDLEPELYPLRGVVFNNCRLFKTQGGTLAADDFNIRGAVFNDCVIENDTNASIYSKVSNIKFNRCTIRGIIDACQPGTNVNQGNFGLGNVNAYPEFNDCELHNTMADGEPAFGYPRLTTTLIAKLNNCTAFVNLDGTSNLAIWGDTSKVNGLRIVLSGQVQEAASALAYFRNHKGLRDVYVENNTAVASGADPANTARIEIGGAGVAGPTENLFIEKSDNGFENVLWENSNRASGGRAGFYMDNYISSRADESEGLLPASKRLGLAKRGYAPLGLYKPQTITSNNAIPTSGNYVRGDVIVNSDPVAAGAFGWMCTTTGTAGSTAVFKVITNIGA
ncbi:MAG: hypothetical protein ACRCXB_29120 [Aeromonadaceae bacterium]